jgi:hypothetical protein
MRPVFIGVHWGAPELAVPEEEPERAVPEEEPEAMPDEPAPDAPVLDDEPDPAVSEAEPEVTGFPNEPETAEPDEGNAPDADVEPAEPETSPELTALPEADPEAATEPDGSIVPEETLASDAASEMAGTPEEPDGNSGAPPPRPLVSELRSPVAQPAASRLTTSGTTAALAPLAANRRTRDHMKALSGVQRRIRFRARHIFVVSVADFCRVGCLTSGGPDCSETPFKGLHSRLASLSL